MVAKLRRHRGERRWLAAVLITLLAVAGMRVATSPPNAAVIGGPLALLLASSSDLGPSRVGDAQLTVPLPDATRPEALFAWADGHGLWVRWRPGNQWAIVEGAAGDVAGAFGVPVNDYKGRKG